MKTTILLSLLVFSLVADAAEKKYSRKIHSVFYLKYQRKSFFQTVM